MTSTALEASQAHLELEMGGWAQQRFPGITNLSWRTANRGASGDSRALIGTWHGVTLEILRLDATTFQAYVVSCCDTCGKYVTSRSRGLESAADLATCYPDGQFPTTVEVCFACQWLLEAQAVARTRRSRLSRWWFAQTRGVTVDDVLARTP